ncbi:MAG: nickel pincer cofactor biosynthesis protein LarB [Deltaproteobacteria bacterium]|nr:nickel pincer cofactor biosynthesis protein LarB [Deltaproteobacteria bacterium]
MDAKRIREILEGVRAGDTSVDAAVESLRAFPYQDLGFASIDHHRPVRQGFAEVIFGMSKPAEQIVAIAMELSRAGSNVLVTRLAADKAEEVTRALAGSRYDPVSRTLVLRQHDPENRGRGPVAVLCAGTSDLPVAEEAAVTADLMGNEVLRLYDVGVAGIHRLLGRRDVLEQARVLIVVAGMEGALPSVVGGLVSKPVIAVPTSVGYGASFHGIAALLGMLNSCAAGVTVVNIDNGFGAGVAASLINRKDA